MSKALPELREDLRALIVEREQELKALNAALDAMSTPPTRRNGAAAPFGYKADGVTPRKRPAPTRETLAKVHASRRAKTAA